MLISGCGYSIPNVALEGDSVNFTCFSGFVLTGPNSSTCMGNGEWEPDPREVACHKRLLGIIINNNIILCDILTLLKMYYWAWCDSVIKAAQ